MSDVRGIWIVARRWFWVLLLGTLLAAGAGFVVSRSLTPTYQATATIVVNQAGETLGRPTYNDVLTSERLARTYGELIQQPVTVGQVISDLGLPMTYEELVEDISVYHVRDTQLITVAVEHPNPDLAADIANAIARTFIGRVHQEQVGETSSTREVLARQIDELEQQISSTSEAIEQARQSEEATSRTAALRSELGQYQMTLAQLLREQREIALAEARASNALRLAQPAVVPTRPIGLSVIQRTLVAAIAGLLLSAGLAFLLETMDHTVKTPELVEKASGLHTLGAIALLGHGSRWRRDRARDPARSRLVVLEDQHSPLSEAFRILRTNVEFAQVDGACRTLMITSPSPGEGKSLVAINFAAVMAQAGKRVLLLDADLRRPTVHQSLSLDNRQGLTNLLAREGLSPEVVAQTTPVRDLFAMTSGPMPPNPAELLGSNRMVQVLARLQELYDLVVLDTPPALAVADPSVLASRVDGVVLVVDATNTSTDALRRTCEALARGTATILGVVLNKVSVNSGSYYYDYYRPYGRAPSSASERAQPDIVVNLPAAEPSPERRSVTPSR